MTGWTRLTSVNQSYSFTTSAVYYKQASASEATPTINSDGSDSWAAICLTIKEYDTTTPIHVESDSVTSSSPGTSAGLTTTNSNCLLVHFANGLFASRDHSPIESRTLSLGALYVGGGEIMAGYSYKETAGSVAGITYVDSFPSAKGLVDIAINDDSGRIPAYLDSSPVEYVAFHPIISGTTAPPGSNSKTLATLIPTVDGNTVTTTTNFQEGGSGIFPFTSGARMWLGGDYPGSYMQPTSDLDLSTGLFGVHIKCESISNGYSVANDGIMVGFRDSAGNWRIYTCMVEDLLLAPYALTPCIIDMDSSNNLVDSSGTLDRTAISEIVFLLGGGPNAVVEFTSMHMINTATIIGGATVEPSTYQALISNAEANSHLFFQNNNFQSLNQYTSFASVQIGNGSDTTVFSAAGASFSFGRKSDSEFYQNAIDDNTYSMTLHGVSGDTIDLSNSSINSNTPWQFLIDASSTSAATWNFSSLLVFNAGTVTLRDIGNNYAGLIITESAEITLNSADLSGGVNVSKCVDAQAVTVTSESIFNDLANCTFTDNAVAILITGNQTGTWGTDPNLTMSGNTFDIEYTGTTNFSIGSVNALTVNNSSSGVLTIVTPVTTFTINSSESGSFIQIFTTATQTVLASTTGASLAYAFVGTVVVDYVVQKAGFLPQRFVGVTLTDSATTVNLPASREYDSGHGLVYTTDASWSRSLNELTVPTFGVTGQGVFSLMMDSFIAESSLFNTAFNLEMDGTGSIFLTNDAEGASDASITNLIECGCAYLDTSSVTTASFVGVKSVGTATGFTGEFQQIDGTTTTDARATGIFNELIKMFGDVSHGNFDFRGHLVLKFQPNTYREARSDVLSDYGISTLAPTLYIVAMEPASIDITAGDPAISITIVDHTGAPLVVGGKSFDFEIQDNGANDGNAMLREVNWNLSQDATYQGRDPFNWPEMILKPGSTFETIFGIVEGLSGLHGIYVSRSAVDHPDFTRHQSNDGTYYVKPITANASISSIVSGSRLRIFNETTATETFNGVPGTSFSDSYTEGTTYTAGDVISIYITQTSGVTAQLPFTTTAIASSAGWTVLAAQVVDTVYNGYGLNGSTITKFTADYVNDEVDLTIASNFSGEELYAWWAFNLTTSQGISDFFGGITAQDAANLLINNSVVSIFLDNTTTTNVIQTDNIRVYRADGAYPVKNPTSGGGGIDVVWRDRVFIAETGVSGLTPGESTELFKNTTILNNTVDIESKVDIVDTNVDNVVVAVITNAAGVDISADIASVQADTDTNLVNQIDGLANFDPSVDVVEGTETFTEAMRLLRANALGDIVDDGVNSATIKSADGLKDRIEATYDSNGGRVITAIDKT